MIIITHSKDRITIQGHAGYAEHGEDVVCAGVSTLVQTLIQSIEDMTEDTIEYSMQSGMVEIRHRNLSANAQLLVDSFFIGMNLIADTYPKNVRIV